MFWPELYSGRQNNNSLEGTPRFVEKHDCSQSKYPARIGKTCEEGRSSFYSSIPSSYCVYEPQHPLIDDNIIYKGDSGSSAYAPPLNAVNVISNSFSIHHETRCGKTENNSLEINPAAYLRKQSEPSALTRDGGGNNFFNIQDFMDERSYSLTPVNKRGKRKPRKAETAAHIRAGIKAHINLQVKRTTRDLKGSRISGPSGRVDRHSKVLTSKGPRDRRIRLSVGTAIKLYWLQDSLGFDQPSKAVEWLIKKSQAAILELPQISSISCSDISQYVDYNSAAVSVSCHQTGDLSTLSQDNTCTASGDCLVKPYEQMLAANTCLGQTSSLVTATERNNRGTIIQGEKREQRSMEMSSVSSRILRAAANSVRRKEFRAKARERARERTKETEKRYNQHSGIYGLLQPSSVPSQSPTFSLHNTSSASSLNMINETRDANSNRDDFLHSLMFPKSSTLCSRSNICISSPPAKIQLSLPSVHCSSTQQEGISIQSTGALSDIHPEVFRVTSDPFPQTAATSNNSSSHFKFCTYPPDHSHLESSIFGGSCREDSIAMAGAHDGRLETSYEWHPERNKEIFQELQVNEEIPSIKSSNEYVPSRVILSNPPAYIGIFDLLQ